MLVLGAGGLFLQMIDDLEACYENITVWADIPPGNGIVNKKFRIISTKQEVLHQFAGDARFIIAIGNPNNRRSLAKKFIEYGGRLTSFISPHANISKYATIKQGTVILHGAIVEANVRLGKGCLINAGALITHECSLGDFVEVGPRAVLAGKAKILANAFIGSNATLLPKVKVGSNAVVGASALVTKNVSGNTVVAGVPAKIIGK